MRYTVRRNLISRNPEINKKKKKRRSCGGGHPCMHVHKYLSNLLHNVYAFSSFPVRKQITLALFRNRKDNIVSTFLLFGSPFPSPFKVRSKFGRFLFPFHPQPFLPGPLGNLKQPMVNQLGLAPSSFVC